MPQTHKSQPVQSLQHMNKVGTNRLAILANMRG